MADDAPGTHIEGWDWRQKPQQEADSASEAPLTSEGQWQQHGFPPPFISPERSIYREQQLEPAGRTPENGHGVQEEV